MIILTETTDKIQVVLSGNVTANQLNCFSTWRDITTTLYTPGRRVVNTNNTTDVDVVEAPASSTQRIVDFISIYNADTTTKTIIVKFDANGTEYKLFQAALTTGEHLEYTDKDGWKVLTNAGSVKTSNNPGSAPVTTTMSVVTITENVVNNNATLNTMQDVTGLVFGVTSGQTYYFRFIIPYNSAATTTGSRWAITAPSAAFLNYHSSYTLAAAGTDATTENYASANDIPAASNATSLTTGNLATIEGFIKASANGNVQARFASEIANSAITALAGATVYYQQVI